MKLYKWLVPAVLIAGCVLLGCKKEEEASYEYMTGKLSLALPPFVEPGFSKSFMIDTMMTMTRPDGGTVGYYFTDPDTGKNDTLVRANGVIDHHYFTMTAPDKVTTQTLRLVAFVDEDAKYYSSSASAPFTIVRPGVTPNSSITHFEYTSTRMVDPRDERDYYTAVAGGREWMRQNLAWEGAGKPYRLCEAMNDVFGRYYTWEEAQTACPDGWQLPSDADWTALAEGAEAGKDIAGLAGQVMADLYFNETKMWEYWREVKITDGLRLSVMPTGYAIVAGEDYTFDSLYKYAAFWTSDESDGLGVCRYIYHDKDIVYRGRMSKTDFAATVRCVKK
jgi:uncharacterized protein (TIGR02145 family)